MNIRDIEAFIAVVDSGSIQAAAARLHLTQPAVTRRVQGLEQDLDTALLDRLSKPLKPTAAGREAYELGRRVLGSVQDLRSGIAANGEVAGEFRLGLTPLQSDDSIAAQIDGLRRAHPQLSLLITTAWSHELLDQVESGRIDAALVYLPGEAAIPQTLSAHPVSRHRMQVVAPKGLALPKRPTLADLAELPWVLSQDGCGFRRTLRDALTRAGLPFVVAVESLGVEMRMALVARGLGLGLATEQLRERSRYRDAVEVLDVRDFKAEIRIWLVHRAEAGRLTALLARFASELKEAATAPLATAGKQEKRRSVARRA